MTEQRIPDGEQIHEYNICSANQGIRTQSAATPV